MPRTRSPHCQKQGAKPNSEGDSPPTSCSLPTMVVCPVYSSRLAWGPSATLRGLRAQLKSPLRQAWLAPASSHHQPFPPDPG